ncbi:MAG: peptide chain release factor N(5)-glutamine methyltransferase [Firmicutes bacterium HGW-Firmicutes-15]|nr:MAG: peptide chain release factor N(5)-glutamine methyltransferase [Firmicutes bacterium HGW-Firmicutes-15]
MKVQKNWRIKDLLEWTTRYFSDQGMQESRLEAEILLAYVLEKNRVYLYANYEEPVNKVERDTFRGYIKRRSGGEPLAYITGQREFMSLSFRVNSDVLIPRPDTEVLVETALALVRAEGIKRICDVGTGSGAIAVSLAVYLNEVEVYALDLSPAALKIARENAKIHEVMVQFRDGDLLEPLVNEEKMDMIVANLPYITFDQLEELETGVKDYEPRIALVASGDGLDLYRRLLPQAYQLLRPGGYILLEIDPRQAEAAKVMMMQSFSELEIIPDWAGRDRLLKARRNY